MKDAKDPFADAYPPGMKPPEDMGDLKSEMTSSKPKAKKPTLTQKKKEMPQTPSAPQEESKDDG